MKVKFVPQNVEYEIKQGQTVMDLAHEKGLPVRSTCNGLPSCAECRVKVVDGEWNLNPPSRKELNLIGTGYYIDQRRLSCQMLCFGDVTVDLQEQVEKGAEGPVTKKFLTKVHKASAEESHSLGGVLIEQEGGLLDEVKKDVKHMREPRDSHRGGQSQARGGQPGRDDNRGDGGGRRRRRRGGRGRGGGGSRPQRESGGGGQRNRPD